MNYWELQQQQDAHASYLADAELVTDLQADGIRPATARAVLLARHGRELRLQRLGADGDTVLGETQPPMPDFLAWSWIPIFSARGRAFCVRRGTSAGDFLPCRFAFQADRYYLHLPVVAEDVVDLERSAFLMTIPSEPPLPFHVERLALRKPPVADIFRATIPGHQQVFSELFVNDQFKHAWEENGFRGAAFRPLGREQRPGA